MNWRRKNILLASNENHADGAGLRLCPPLTMDKREFDEFMVQAVEEKLQRMKKGED